jgi:hypothetical protein
MSEQRPNPSIHTDAGDKTAGAGYVRRWAPQNGTYGIDSM